MGACFLGSVKKEKREREKLYGTKQGFFFETPSQISLRQRKRPVISREAGLKSDLEKKKKKSLSKDLVLLLVPVIYILTFRTRARVN